MPDKPKITTKELGYHRFVLTVNGHEIGPERSCAASLQEVWAWIEELPFAELLPILSNVAEHAADDTAGTVSISEMQDEVAEWALRNFGETPQYRPLLGMIEELGEICATFSNIAQNDDFPYIIIRAMAHFGKIAHSRLKTEQGIRGSAEEHQAKADAQLLPILNLLSMLYPRIFSDSCDDATTQVGIPEIVAGSWNFEKTDTIKDGVGDLFVYACHFSELMDIPLEEAIFTTWAHVKRRDWLKNNKTGEELPAIENVKPILGNEEAQLRYGHSPEKYVQFPHEELPRSPE